MNSHDLSTIEVELKFRVENLELLRERLLSMGALPSVTESHQDTYFRHPCRDFTETREALRIRRVEVVRANNNDLDEPADEARVTYKGPPLAGDVKARHELEWALQPSDPDGQNLQRLLVFLGFSAVTTVRKSRRSMTLVRAGRAVTLALDEVVEVGTYVEVEVLAEGEKDVATAREIVGKLAAELNLVEPERRSYLSLLLGK